VESMLAMDYVSEEAVESVLSEFGQIWGKEYHAVAEPRARVRHMLETALGADQVETYLGNAGQAAAGANPFAPLERLEPEQLAGLLGDEHAQTIAIVLSRIDPRKAGQVLAKLTQSLAADVARCMVGSGQSTPDAVLQSIGRVLAERAQEMAGEGSLATPRGRVALVAKVLSATSRGTREAALGSVREHDPDAGQELREMMFLFEDLRRLKPEDLRKVMSAVDTQTVALATKTASDELRECMFGAISKRAAQTIREEQGLLGPRPLSEVENAQQAIVDTVTRLAAEGQIRLRRDENEEMV